MRRSLIAVVLLAACEGEVHVSAASGQEAPAPAWAEPVRVSWGYQLREFRREQATCYVLTSGHEKEAPALFCVPVRGDGGTP